MVLPPPRKESFHRWSRVLHNFSRAYPHLCGKRQRTATKTMNISITVRSGWHRSPEKASFYVYDMLWGAAYETGFLCNRQDFCRSGHSSNWMTPCVKYILPVITYGLSIAL